MKIKNKKYNNKFNKKNILIILIKYFIVIVNCYFILFNRYLIYLII